MSSQASADPLLHLVEIAVEPPGDGAELRQRAEGVVSAAGGTVVETVWAEHLGRFYLIAQGIQPAALQSRLNDAGLRAEEIAPVRLIGAPADRSGPAPSHLVEWDLPSDLGMERYLKRKAEKSPLYAQVPEVQFLRTYVREDTVKCLCLYDAPDEDAVRRARAAVGAPISRLDRVSGDITPGPAALAAGKR